MKISKFIFFSTLIFCSIYAYPNYKLAYSYLPKNPVILNCGANQGRSSIEILKAVHDATIYSVEADPYVFHILKEKVKNYPQIHPFQSVLTDHIGQSPFYPNSDKKKANAQGSTFPQSNENWYWNSAHLKKNPVLLPSLTLDEFCKVNHIEKIDFLALDMQGGELAMLKSSPKILSKVSVIVTEVLYEQIYQNAPLYPTVKKFLKKQGFVEKKHIKKHKSWGDALFVRN